MERWGSVNNDLWFQRAGLCLRPRGEPWEGVLEAWQRPGEDSLEVSLGNGFQKRGMEAEGGTPTAQGKYGQPPAPDPSVHCPCS